MSQRQTITGKDIPIGQELKPIIDERWQGPGSLEEVLAAMRAQLDRGQLTYDRVVDLIYAASGVKVSRNSVRNWVGDLRGD